MLRHAGTWSKEVRFCLGSTSLEVDKQRQVHPTGGKFLAAGFMTTRPRHRLPIALRHCRLLIVALWALTLIQTLVLAQVNEGQLPDVQVVPPSPAVHGSSASLRSVGSTNFIPVTVRGPCDPDYWVVSTRGAKSEVENGQACSYDVIRFDGPNPGRCSSMDELQASLQPGTPVCFMVHGSFVTFESMLQDSSHTYHWLRQAAPCQPLHIIFYTWASNDDCLAPHIHVNKLGRRASLNGFYLADLVSKVSLDHPICLIGHSHGSRLVSSALHSMAGGVIEGRMLAKGAQPPRRIRVVLAAAAIDHNWLNPNEKYGRALCQAEAVINLRNHADFPLLFYPLRRPSSSPALAITGLTYRDRLQLGDWNQKIVDYDVSGLVGLGHIWAHYCTRPEIATAIRHYVYFDEPQPPPIQTGERGVLAP